MPALRRRRFAVALSILVVGLSGMDKGRPAYPPTKTEPVSDVLHGQTVSDPYRWLEDGDSPAVKEWSAKQIAFTRGVLDHLPGREQIAKRLDQLLQIGSIGVPHPHRGKYFYTRREGKQNQPVLYVREGLDGKDRVLLDVNALDAAGTTALDWYFPSDDGSLLAYGLSVGGSEMSTLRVRDVMTGKDLPVMIDRCRACSLAWLPDSKSFYYTRYPAKGTVADGEETYHRHVFYHRLGDDPANDKKVFGAGRAKEDWPNIALSPDGKWLAVTEQQGWAKTEVYVADVSGGAPTFQPLVEGVPAIFNVDLTNDALFIRTNDQAPKYKIYRTTYGQLGRTHWKEIIPEGQDVIENAHIVGDTLATVMLHKATSQVRLHDLHGKMKSEVALPTLGSVAGLSGEHDGKELFFGFHSFTLPVRIIRVDLATNGTAVWNKVTADIDFDAYEVKQVEYPSKDGTMVTMFLASKKGMKRDGKNPTLLYGYGGFNISLTPSFAASRFLFLERGGVLAIANLRGGGEYGEEWHQKGMLGNKQNVFDDFIAAAEWLIKEKVTNRDRLAIQGGSNGGLLVGAALTQRPDLFRAVVCQVPLLDMIRYHRFQIARLWIPEYGSSENSEQFNWLSRYSPYHHVKKGTAYPATLIATAESDTRVDPLHARKMTALLQASTSSDQPILLRLEAKAGHGAGKPRGKQLEELTDIYAFLFAKLGMTE